MPEFLIRLARYDDLAEVQTLYRQLSPSSPELSAEAAAPIWREVLSDSKMHVLVAEQGGVWGTVTLVVMPNLTQGGRPYALIENVVTRTDKRGQGVGKALMAAAVALARSRGAYKVMLVTGRRAPEVHRLYGGSGLRSDAVAYFARLEEHPPVTAKKLRWQIRLARMTSSWPANIVVMHQTEKKRFTA